MDVHCAHGYKPATLLRTSRRKRPRIDIKGIDETVKPLNLVDFLLAFAREPKLIGAIAPSSKQLGAAMAAPCRHRLGLGGDAPQTEGASVVELGPGTGVVTRCLLEAGVLPDRLTLVEKEERFARQLRGTFGDLRVVQGDAMHLDSLLGREFAHFIVSSLPLRNFSAEAKHRLLSSVTKTLGPQGRFIQFSYGRQGPVPADFSALTPVACTKVLLNLPPAKVWVYSKKSGSIQR